MGFAVDRIDERLSYGVIVSALDADDIGKRDVQELLRELWVQEGLIIFSGLNASGETQVALSRVFGEPGRHPLASPGRMYRIPELADIYYRPDEGDIVTVRGERKGGYLPWHFDLVYLQRINRGGIIRSITRAPQGGETGFLDGVDLYTRLPDDLKLRIEGLYVIYLYDPDMNSQRYGVEPGFHHERIQPRSQEAFEQLGLPPVAHPLVYSQPGTGRKVLNFSPWYATGIDGMMQDEADEILHRVAPYCVDHDRAYFHRWDGDEMVLWDNWRMLHYAAGVPCDEARHVQRTTIHGDYAQGRSLTNERARDAP